LCKEAKKKDKKFRWNQDVPKSRDASVQMFQRMADSGKKAVDRLEEKWDAFYKGCKNEGADEADSRTRLDQEFAEMVQLKDKLADFIGELDQYCSGDVWGDEAPTKKGSIETALEARSRNLATMAQLRCS
jgi:hypothetical protein